MRVYVLGLFLFLHMLPVASQFTEDTPSQPLRAQHNLFFPATIWTGGVLPE